MMVQLQLESLTCKSSFILINKHKNMVDKASVIKSIEEFAKKHANTFGPMFLLSIDPGFNNLGFAFIN